MKREVEFKVEEEILRGMLFMPEGRGPFPSVIFFHGSGSTGETYFKAAQKLSENGILGFAFNYRGCGVSDGKFENQTIGMGAEDANVAVNFFLSQKEVGKGRIGFSGASFGGFIAALLSRNFNPKSLALIAPAAYSPAIINKTHRDTDEIRKDFESSDSYKEIAKFGGDLLVIKCEFDDILPPLMVEKYLQSAQNTKRKEQFVLAGAKHSVSRNPQAQAVLIDRIKDWFIETL